VIGIALLLPALGIAGCGVGAFQRAEPSPSAADAPPTTAGTKETLTPQSEPPLERLPLPVGFELDPRVSHRYHTDKGRVLLHVYKGPASKDEVEQFYRHVMRLTGWEYQGSQMVRGAVELRFEQDDEWADLTIRDHWSLLFGEGSRIEARIQTLTPESSGAGRSSGASPPARSDMQLPPEENGTRSTSHRTGN